MKSLQVRLPNSVHNRLRNLAEKEGVSLNQVIVTAASNEVIRQETREFFVGASQPYDAEAFEAALAAVPDVSASVEDQK